MSAEPLSEEEWVALLQRCELARRDDRGPEVRIGTYAERMRLNPRLIATVSELKSQLEESELNGWAKRDDQLRQGIEHRDDKIADLEERLGKMAAALAVALLLVPGDVKCGELRKNVETYEGLIAKNRELQEKVNRLEGSQGATT